MNNTALYNESHAATYCPEDNKLRLYVGRVPREEYLALKAEGWTSTPKQDCNFVATWTPERRDTCESYAGVICDEDMSPQDRAADRAERFSGYLDKRTAEATGHADRYDSGPAVHGYQDYGRACRAADKHDRIGTRAVDAWSKAEYWQRRTAGVISHALYKSEPGVRMGRINELEAHLRRVESYRESDWRTDWKTHLELRLSYERQMLAAQGGTTETMEILPGGKLNGRLILKVNKSAVTKRPKSCDTVGLTQPTDFPQHRRHGKELPKYAVRWHDLERKSQDAYEPPTPESLAELKAIKADMKALDTSPKAPPLINLTDEDAERLQAIWNERAAAKHAEAIANRKTYGVFQPAKIRRITQAIYSANSGGTYTACETQELCGNAEKAIKDRVYFNPEALARKKAQGLALCKIRLISNSDWYTPDSVIVLTDKPQKPLPAAVWETPVTEPVFELTAV